MDSVEERAALQDSRRRDAEKTNELRMSIVPAC
jgi:hypothetical protein